MKPRRPTKPPCGKCPYKLGLVHTLATPCPQCRETGRPPFPIFQRPPEGGR